VRIESEEMISSSAGAIDQEVGQPNKMRYTLAVFKSAFQVGVVIRIDAGAIRYPEFICQ
jgi:hypothetical protein